MKTREIKNDDGLVVGFAVDSTRLTRWGVPSIIRTIPGAQIIRQQRRFRLAGPDDFCEFVLDGTTFLVIEPFGDSSEFWIVETDAAGRVVQIARVRAAFEQYHGIFGFFAG